MPFNEGIVSVCCLGTRGCGAPMFALPLSGTTLRGRPLNGP